MPVDLSAPHLDVGNDARISISKPTLTAKGPLARPAIQTTDDRDQPGLKKTVDLVATSMMKLQQVIMMKDVPLDPKHRGRFINDQSARSHGGEIMLPPEDDNDLIISLWRRRQDLFVAIISFSSLADRPWDYSLLPFSNTNTAGIISSLSLLEFGPVTTDITRMQGLASACVLVSFRRSPS